MNVFIWLSDISTSLIFFCCTDILSQIPGTNFTGSAGNYKVA
jgi:hypothetical protein